MTTTPNSGALALTAAARRAGRIVRDTATLPVPGWRWVPDEPKEKKDGGD